MGGFFGGGGSGSGGPPNIIDRTLPAGQTDNYSVTFSLSIRNVLNVTTDAGGSTLSGIDAPPDPPGALTLGITNAGPGDLTLLDASASSDPENRFEFGDLGDYVLPPGAGLELWYDSDADRWRILST